jgi:hypothetical protein
MAQSSTKCYGSKGVVCDDANMLVLMMMIMVYAVGKSIFIFFQYVCLVTAKVGYGMG